MQKQFPTLFIPGFFQDKEDHINLETYIFEDDEVGRRFADLLLEKQGEGVQVNLIYDSVGCLNTPAAFFERLRDGGVQTLEFNPVNPLKIRPLACRSAVKPQR